ncbi:hypothetical protein GRI62_00510 [Erythrobacter arachoides]|uniref:Uncharacterized protein n=1 Tax=Aurantiacibacter arachoides TaxID=1850444 RepID=A0A844ZZC7_9SPHN|nr:hypothetical protein [Aurantiacibacter arachoides]MXO92087.1 hypothetical protein [Aurantiacibacter arachoides]GGD59842.1 hypothetical protein GCM10011411_20030 [Aurantiacibacter arachoides]
MKSHPIAAAITLALAVTASPSLACSVVADYRVPTNLELVEEADVIVLGRVTGQQVTGDDPWDVALMVEPIEAIRGAVPDGPLLLAEMTIARDEFASLSNPYELQHAHPEAGSGSCTRYTFPEGSVVLFFLERDGDGLRSLGAPFARSSEDVLTADAPWLRLVRFYAQVVAAPAAQRDAMLQAEEARYAALAHDPVARLMAADIARQRAGPNRPLHEAMDAEMGAYADAMANAEAAMEASDQVEVTEGEDGMSLQGTMRLGPVEGADKPERHR